MLYWEAFGHGADRVQQLYAEVLVSSVSIMIYGHFAVAEPTFPVRDISIIAIRSPSLFFYCLKWCGHVQSV